MNFIKRWLRGWRLVFLIAFLLLAGLIGSSIYKSKNDTSNIQTELVKQQDLKQSVLATGVVTSSTDLNLGFKASGTVRSVNAAVGRKATAGQVLATLDQKDQLATLTQARAALASAQANYEKILAGASNEDIAVAQAALDAAKATLASTKSQQEVLVKNALSALYNSTLNAVTTSYNAPTVTVSGSYNSTEEGQYVLSGYNTGTGPYISYSGLESGTFLVQSSAPIALGTRGLYVQFSSTTNVSSAVWTIDIPNKQAANYLTNLNAYNSALQTQAAAISAAQSAVDQAQATLNLKKAQARPADIQAAQAQILSAQGQVAAANAALENTIVRAPVEGTITKVDIKVGQNVASQQAVIVLQDVDHLYLEANISEANISQIIVGQEVDVTFDALSPDRHFTATVANIDLSSTVVSGVVNYKVTANLEMLQDIRPGMTANMTILTGEKSDTLAVPARAVISKDGKKYLRVVTDPKKKTYQEVEVVTGFEADGGLVEVLQGVTANQEIITFIEKK